MVGADFAIESLWPLVLAFFVLVSETFPFKLLALQLAFMVARTGNISRRLQVPCWLGLFFLFPRHMTDNGGLDCSSASLLFELSLTTEAISSGLKIENRRIFRFTTLNMVCFIRQSPEDLSIPNVPKGYSFLVRTDGDATFARELLCANDIILRFVNLKIGSGESVDGDHTKWSYVFEQFWKLANDHLLVPLFYS